MDRYKSALFTNTDYSQPNYYLESNTYILQGHHCGAEIDPDPLQDAISQLSKA